MPRLKRGNEIVTSYLSDKFLPGLTIGYITSVTEDASTLTRTAKVTPVVDFEHLRDVLVITQLKADLVEGGESSTSEETSQSSTSESGSDSTTQTQETDAPAE